MCVCFTLCCYFVRNFNACILTTFGLLILDVSFMRCRMSITEGCEAEKITSLVKQHVPKAELCRQHEAELTFTLPFESMDTFPGQKTLSTYVT